MSSRACGASIEQLMAVPDIWARSMARSATITPMSPPIPTADWLALSERVCHLPRLGLEPLHDPDRTPRLHQRAVSTRSPASTPSCSTWIETSGPISPLATLSSARSREKPGHPPCLTRSTPSTLKTQKAILAWRTPFSIIWLKNSHQSLAA